MANILERIDVAHGEQLWNKVYSCQALVDFHKPGLIIKFTWNDVYDVIAYERSMKMEPLISAMLATNLVKGKIRMSYLTRGDVFSGTIDDRLHDVYNDIYLVFCRRIPVWDMSYGVYLDKFLERDIDSCVRKSADFTVYGTGRGSYGPGIAVSLSESHDERSDTHTVENLASYSKLHKTITELREELVINGHGEIFENIEKSAGRDSWLLDLTQEVFSRNPDQETIQELIYLGTSTHNFKIPIPAKSYAKALDAVKEFLFHEPG